MRREMEIEVLELAQESLPPIARARSGKIVIAVLGMAVLAGLQLIPAGPPRTLTTTTAPGAAIPTTPVEVVEGRSEFHWVEVGGLDRFESVTKPLSSDLGYLTVANSWGANRAASVMLSKDGSEWNRWGTIHGVGGEVEISAVRRSSDGFLAFGIYTEVMPKTEYALHERLPAVWSSESGIRWEMHDMSYTSLGVGMSSGSLDSVDFEGLLLNGSLDYFGNAGDAIAFLHTETTPTVTMRKPGMRGDPFAIRVDEETQSLLITRDQENWVSEVVPFQRIRFVGDVGGTFLITAWSDAEPTEASYWLITP